MLDKILALEKRAKNLEPNKEVRNSANRQVLQYSELFLDNISSIKAYEVAGDKGRGLYEMPIQEEARDIETILSKLKKEVDTPGLNPASGGHLGYIPGGGIYFSALGDYLADVFNRYSGVFYASPGAVRMENLLVDWMCKLVGFSENALGNLTSGGSIANLIAVVTARDASKITGKDYDQVVVYMTEQVHHSLDKSLRIAGLKEAVYRYVPIDDHYRMDAASLEDMINEDLSSGLKPLMVIASAGTTDTGAIDPLQDIGLICRQQNIWFHVDGAYGAFFILTEEGKEKLKGIELADSVVMDPHKGLFLPYGCGAVLIKEGRLLAESHYYTANYLQDTINDQEESSPADLSPELTKHFRGLRLWLPLMAHGLDPFRACLEEKLLLAKYFREKLSKVDGFVVGPEPDLSVVTYYYTPKNGDQNDFNDRLLQEVKNDGRIFISSTMIDGVFTLRLAILSFRTHLDYIDLALEVLRSAVKKLDV